MERCVFQGMTRVSNGACRRVPDLVTFVCPVKRSRALLASNPTRDNRAEGAPTALPAPGRFACRGHLFLAIGHPSHALKNAPFHPVRADRTRAIAFIFTIRFERMSEISLVHLPEHVAGEFEGPRNKPGPLVLTQTGRLVFRSVAIRSWDRSSFCATAGGLTGRFAAGGLAASRGAAARHPSLQPGQQTATRGTARIAASGLAAGGLAGRFASGLAGGLAASGLTAGRFAAGWTAAGQTGLQPGKQAATRGTARIAASRLTGRFASGLTGLLASGLTGRFASGLAASRGAAGQASAKAGNQTATRRTARITTGGLAAGGLTGRFAASRLAAGGLAAAGHPAEQPRLSVRRDNRKQHSDRREEDTTLHGRNSL